MSHDFLFMFIVLIIVITDELQVWNLAWQICMKV